MGFWRTVTPSRSGRARHKYSGERSLGRAERVRERELDGPAGWPWRLQRRDLIENAGAGFTRRPSGEVSVVHAPVGADREDHLDESVAARSAVEQALVAIANRRPTAAKDRGDAARVDVALSTSTVDRAAVHDRSRAWCGIDSPTVDARLERVSLEVSDRIATKGEPGIERHRARRQCVEDAEHEAPVLRREVCGCQHTA